MFFRFARCFLGLHDDGLNCESWPKVFRNGKSIVEARY